MLNIACYKDFFLSNFDLSHYISKHAISEITYLKIEYFYFMTHKMLKLKTIVYDDVLCIVNYAMPYI